MVIIHFYSIKLINNNALLKKNWQLCNRDRHMSVWTLPLNSMIMYNLILLKIYYKLVHFFQRITNKNIIFNNIQ